MTYAKPLRNTASAGFGAKTEEKILQALEGREATGRRVLLAEAKVFADAAVRHLQQTPGADQGCLLELNSQPHRLDLEVTALMAAMKRGVGIVVSTAAHSVEELGQMEFGVYQARRAGLEARDVANTRTLA